MSRRFSILVTLAISVLPLESFAVQLRKQVNQHGDFAIIGNTTGHDCTSSTGMPVVGTVGMCGAFTDDKGDDVFWRSEDPGPGQARADLTNIAIQARSTALLSSADIPMGASVSYARIYWGAVITAAAPSGSVVLERPNGFMSNVTADSVTTVKFGNNVWYQATADVTQQVQQNGLGAYRVSGVDSLNLGNLNDDVPYIGWSMVVLYDLPTAPLRNLSVYDGMTLVNNASVDTLLGGFVVSPQGFAGRLGVVAWETDVLEVGDALLWNGTPLSNGLNPADNFFNSTRSTLGNAVSVMGDLPQMAGTPGSMSGIDIDIVDVTPLLMGGETSATVRATSTNDAYGLGVVVLSLSSRAPSFAGSTKTVKNLTRSDGTNRKGDVLEYTITIKNSGNDKALETTVTDALPKGLTFVPGSLEIVSGANAGAKTDPPMDDQAEYTNMTRTATYRIGAGANASMGGTLDVNESSIVRFRATIDPDAKGVLKNQAIIQAKGEGGGGSTTTVTSSNNGPETTTDVIVDGCKEDSECPMDKPICDPMTRECRPCMNDADCKGGRCITTGPAAGACSDRLSLEGGGCGCTSASNATSVSALLSLAVLVLLRRRRAAR